MQQPICRNNHYDHIKQMPLDWPQCTPIMCLIKDITVHLMVNSDKFAGSSPFLYNTQKWELSQFKNIIIIWYKI